MNKYERIPERIIDLHGKTCREAEMLLSDIFKKGKFSHMRIITGKGIYREKVGTLHECVRNYFIKNNLSYNPSKRENGGDGAFEIYQK